MPHALTAAGHQLPWRHRRLPDRVAALLPAVAGEVERHLRTALPPVQVIVTPARGMAELAIAADAELTGEQPARPSRLRSQLARASREAQGRAVPTRGGVLVLLRDEAVAAAASDADLAVLLAHELVHAAQFARSAYRGHLVPDALDRLGVAPYSRRDGRAAEARIRADEDEAYAAEHPIATAATAPRRRASRWW